MGVSMKICIGRQRGKNYISSRSGVDKKNLLQIFV